MEDSQCTCNTEARSRNNSCCGKAVSSTYLCVCASVRVGVGAGVRERACVCERVALPIQHAKRRSIAFLASPHFSTLSHKRYDLRKIVTEHKMCVLIFPTTFNWDIFHSNKNSARYCHKCKKRLHVKYPLFLSDINGNWYLLNRFTKKAQLSYFIKTRPWGTQFHADEWTGGETNVRKPIIAFHNFANAPDNRRLEKRKIIQTLRRNTCMRNSTWKK